MKPRNGKHYRLAEGLCGLLADTYVLYNTTQVAHWNVDGPRCDDLHELFEKQYRELGAAVDRIAERMRDLGIYAPGTLGDYIRFSRLRQATEGGLQLLLKQLVEGHETVRRRIRMVLEITLEADDEMTTDLLRQRLRAHETTGSALLHRLMETIRDDPLAGSSRQGSLPLGPADLRQRVPA